MPAAIKPGMPAPAIGPGTAVGGAPASEGSIEARAPIPTKTPIRTKFMTSPSNYTEFRIRRLVLAAKKLST